MKIVFMGTPDFAVPVLEALSKEHEVVCVYTRAPKEAGRGQKESKTPVHLFAERHGIEVRTPKSLRNAEEQENFKILGADAAVVAAYGLILPKEVLEAYRWGVSMSMPRCCRVGAVLRRYSGRFWPAMRSAA